jgi:hypothetical protein
MAVQTRRRCPRHANRTSAFRTSVVSSTVRRLSGSPRCTPKHSRELEGPPLFSPAPSFASRAPSCRRFVTSRAALSSLRGPAAVRGKYLVKFFFSDISISISTTRRRCPSLLGSYLVTVTML